MITYRSLLAVGALLLFSATLNALPVLVGTGMDAAGTSVLALGQPDSRYCEGTTGAPCSNTMIRFDNVNYLANGPNSAWISPDANGCISCTTYPVTVAFALSAAEVANTLLQGFWAVDNGGAIELNGSPATGSGALALSAANVNHAALHAFTITSGFVQGTNTLTIQVSNNADGGPSAVRLEGSLTATAIPEPGALALVAAGLLGIGASRLRRRAR
jgi:hypothetical protein